MRHLLYFNKEVVMIDNDTIVAIATGMTSGGISIIRVSGCEAFNICDKLFVSSKGTKSLHEMKTHSIHYGHIVIKNEILDEVLLSVMKAPNTYTREDVVEINCHGGILVTKRILEAVISSGARLAEPGEFTKRAFLNGRIDLSQAEAVMDLINATNDRAIKNSVSQLSGKLKQNITNFRNAVISDIAYIEAALDDPEHISLDGFSDTLRKNVIEYISHIDTLVKSFSEGKFIREGIKTVIIGKPNVGKSTLMNVLVGDERAIVTDIPGTTRDILEELISFSGITLRLIDTAGIRNTEDHVEQIGVERAMSAAKDADLIIYVVDASLPLSEEDKKIISFINDKKAIILLNKSDLKMVITQSELKTIVDKPIFTISAKNENGIDQISECISKMFFNNELNSDDTVFVSNVRHISALNSAKQSFTKVIESIDSGLPEDFYSIDLQDAYASLGEIIGETVEDDLVDKIFKDFCMGK